MVSVRQWQHPYLSMKSCPTGETISVLPLSDVIGRRRERFAAVCLRRTRMREASNGPTFLILEIRQREHSLPHAYKDTAKPFSTLDNALAPPNSLAVLAA